MKSLLSKTKFHLVWVFTLAFFFQNCSQNGFTSKFSDSSTLGSQSSSASGGGCTTPTISYGGAANVVPITFEANQLNAPTVSVTICQPCSDNCQTINNILIDTGSTGLRIKKSLITLSLPQVQLGSTPEAECYQFGSGFAYWGAVEQADVFIGGELVKNMNFQAIDKTYAGSVYPADCSKDTNGNAMSVLDPGDAGIPFNGLIGILPTAYDCGPAGSTGVSCSVAAQTGPPFYYACPNNANCTDATVTPASEVPNPIAMLATDNNGYLIQTAAITANGATTAAANLILGIGTQSNNVPPSTVKTIPLTPTDAITFVTVLDATDYESFIDSGSDIFAFAPPTTPNITQCDVNAGATPPNPWIMFCPVNPIALSFTMEGYAGTPSISMSVSISNASTAMQSVNYLFDNVGEPSGAALSALGSSVPIFDFGYSFFFGRTIYFGMAGRSSSLGTGPYDAF